jgi:hypothetical protein
VDARGCGLEAGFEGEQEAPVSISSSGTWAYTPLPKMAPTRSCTATFAVSACNFAGCGIADSIDLIAPAPLR